jgi:ferric-dicitrate binding protein FerR (iron transport regulator)
LEKDNEYIDALIARCLSGNASEEDQSELRTWRNASAENDAYYEDVAIIYEASVIQHNIDVDADAAWNKLSSQIERKETTPVVPLHSKGNSNRWILSIAAAVLLLAGITAIIFRLNNKTADQNTLALVTQDKAVEQTLPDGSNIKLRPNSSLKAIKGTVPHSREYELQGEGTFTVKHDAQKPFIIHTDKVLIRDIGTSFTVRSLAESDSVTVSVSSGEVQFYAERQEGVNLTAGETGVYLKSASRFSKRSKNDAPEEQKEALKFNDTPLSDVVTKLNALYKAHIQFGNEKIKHCRITVRFTNNNVDDMIDVIAQTLSLQRSRQDSVTTLYGKGCD